MFDSSKNYRKTLILATILCCLTTFYSRAQDIRVQLQKIAFDLGKKIEAKGKKRILLSSFLNSANEETELGRYMADKFAAGMEDFNFLITDRSQVQELLRQNKLQAQQILDPKTAPALKQISGADVVVTGNYSVFDNYIEITIKAIDLAQGIRLAGAEGTIVRNMDVNNLLVVAKNPAPPVDPIYDLPKSDCQPPGGIFYGKLTIENQLKEPVVLYWIYGSTHDGRGEHMISPGDKYLTELISLGSDIGSKNHTFMFHTTEREEDMWRYGKIVVDVKGCKVKPLTLSNRNFFLGKTKPSP